MRMPVGFFDAPSFRWAGIEAEPGAGGRSPCLDHSHARQLGGDRTEPAQESLNGNDRAYHLLGPRCARAHRRPL